MREYEILIQKTKEYLKSKKDTYKKEMILDLFHSLTSNTFKEKHALSYDLWVETWIIPKLYKLIPELNKIKKQLDALAVNSELEDKE